MPGHRMLAHMDEGPHQREGAGGAPFERSRRVLRAHRFVDLDLLKSAETQDVSRSRIRAPYSPTPWAFYKSS